MPTQEDIKKMIEDAVRAEEKKVIELESQLDSANSEIQRLNEMISERLCTNELS